jgi:hypothetical protein
VGPSNLLQWFCCHSSNTIHRICIFRWWQCCHPLEFFENYYCTPLAPQPDCTLKSPRELCKLPMSASRPEGILIDRCRMQPEHWGVFTAHWVFLIVCTLETTGPHSDHTELMLLCLWNHKAFYLFFLDQCICFPPNFINHGWLIFF